MPGEAREEVRARSVNAFRKISPQRRRRAQPVFPLFFLLIVRAEEKERTNPTETLLAEGMHRSLFPFLPQKSTELFRIVGLPKREFVSKIF